MRPTGSRRAWPKPVQPPGPEHARVAAARIDLGAPVPLDVVGGLERARPEQPRHVPQHRVAALGLGQRAEHPRVAALDEAEQRAGTAARRADVEHDLGGAGKAGGGAAEPVLAPERLVVDRHALDHRSHRHPLGELVARRGQARLVVDAARERRRQRHDRPARPQAADDRRRRPRTEQSPDRRLQPHAVAERLGHLQRDQLRAADDARLLGAALGVEQVVPAAGRGGVEEHVQQ